MWNRLSFDLLGRFEALSQKLYHSRQNRDQDDSQYGQGEVLFDDRQVTKEIASESEEGYPNNRTDNVIYQEARIIHGTDPGHKWGKGADNGDEAGQDDRLAAVFFIKFVGAIQIFFLQEADIPTERFWPDVMPDPVIYCIAQDGSKYQGNEQYPDIQ